MLRAVRGGRDWFCPGYRLRCSLIHKSRCSRSQLRMSVLRQVENDGIYDIYALWSGDVWIALAALFVRVFWQSLLSRCCLIRRIYLSAWSDQAAPLSGTFILRVASQMTLECILRACIVYVVMQRERSKQQFRRIDTMHQQRGVHAATPAHSVKHWFKWSWKQVQST